MTSKPTIEDDNKSLQKEIADLEPAMDDDKEPTLKIESKVLDDDMRALNKEVANYIEQREAFHAEYSETLASNKAAVDKNKQKRVLAKLSSALEKEEYNS